MDTQYKWRFGYRSKVKADAAAIELERMANAAGSGVTPEMVVDDARPSTSPLHEAFTWDDHIAAEERRRDQARNLIAALVFVVEEGEKYEEVRAFVNVEVALTDEGPKEHLYVRTQVALAHNDMRQQVLQQALQQIQGWEKRYRQYTELAPIIMAIKDVRSNLTGALAAA